MPDPVPPSPRPLDIIVWGATGFTGRLVAGYLARCYPPTSTIRWGIAGRNERKLQELAKQLPDVGDLPVLLASIDDRDSMQRLARAATVVVTTVGPYARYGTALLEACVENGTGYCDLCGEVQWIRQMIDRFETAARASGARIVTSCGFDSIPSDIGVMTLQAISVNDHAEPCNEVAMRVRAMKGSASGGTIASMLNAITEARASRQTARVLADPFALVPEEHRHDRKASDQTEARFDDAANTWTAPFVMAAVNTRIVYRSSALLGDPWGKDFRYSESTVAGTGLTGRFRATLISLGLKGFVLASAMPLTQKLLRGFLPKPGEGPSADARQRGFYKLHFDGRTPGGKKVSLVLTGDRDPGYGSTSKMLAEAAVCLAIDKVPAAGGFWTPASLLGSKLQRRLARNAGLRFVSEGQEIIL